MSLKLSRTKPVTFPTDKELLEYILDELYEERRKIANELIKSSNLDDYKEMDMLLMNVGLSLLEQQSEMSKLEIQAQPILNQHDKIRANNLINDKKMDYSEKEELMEQLVKNSSIKDNLSKFNFIPKPQEIKEKKQKKRALSVQNTLQPDDRLKLQRLENNPSRLLSPNWSSTNLAEEILEEEDSAMISDMENDSEDVLSDLDEEIIYKDENDSEDEEYIDINKE